MTITPRRQALRLTVAVLICSIVCIIGQTPLASAQPAQIRDKTQWLCSPTQTADPCHLPTDTTDLNTGKRTAPTVVPDSQKPVDCFYVYPTVTNEIVPNAPLTKSPEVQSIARFQAARFRNMCRIYAPLYRQVSFPGVISQFVGTRLSGLAYSDVRTAWREYLAHHNNGRGVVLIGHSQGGLLLRKLIREEIDPNPVIRKKLVGAFLMAGNATTARGRTTGGDFTNIPVCTKPRQFGCVVGYSTTVSTPTTPYTLFGNAQLDLLSEGFDLPTPRRGLQTICTDPAVLDNDPSPVGIAVPSRPFSFGIVSLAIDYSAFPRAFPTSSSTWTISKEKVTGHCIDSSDQHLYELRIVNSDRQLNEIPFFHTHVIDMNVGLDRLVSIARKQSAAWLANH